MQEQIPDEIRKLADRAREVINCEGIAAGAQEIDAECRWPERAIRGLQKAGLTGLHVPERLGGCGEGLLALSVITETLGQACSSTSMCYGMHCVGTAVIAAKASPDQERRYLQPIAEGRHLTTLALSETATGIHFYLPQTQLERDEEGFTLNGEKQFVTNGGYVDSYVVSTLASSMPDEPGHFNCLVVDGGSKGMTWLNPWTGFGMRGNHSRGLKLENVRLPKENLLGQEGDEIWYAFEVVAPYFLVAMAGTYLGIAQAAYDATIQDIQSRRYGHSGELLSEAPVIQDKIAAMWMALERSRLMVYNAARLGDLGSAKASLAIMAAKAEVGDMVVWMTNEAMSLCGGRAYRDNSALARLLRDARACHVMAPTTNLLRMWTGRHILGLPII